MQRRMTHLLYALLWSVVGIAVLLAPVNIVQARHNVWKTSASNGGFDYIMAMPCESFDKFFTVLQETIKDRLHAQAIGNNPGLFTIKQMRCNLTTNHRQNVPLKPHISLKTIPVERRQQAIAAIPCAPILHALKNPMISITGLIAWRGLQAGNHNKIFIVAMVQCHKQSLYALVPHLDKLMPDVPGHGSNFTAHITVAKIMPFRKGSGVISDSTLKKLNQQLEKMWRDVCSGSCATLCSRQYSIESIEYVYHDDGEARNPLTLWPIQPVYPEHHEQSIVCYS